MIELPESCFYTHPETGDLVVLKRGMSGYYELEIDVEGNRPSSADDLNRVFGITSKQVDAMLAGSMFGWDCPAARGEVP